MTRVVNLTKFTKIPKEWVYIGRAGNGEDGYFGNPYLIGQDGSREAVISLYTEWFIEKIEVDPIFRERILGLWDKTLMCFCKPLACHGDIIAAYLDYED